MPNVTLSDLRLELNFQSPCSKAKPLSHYSRWPPLGYKLCEEGDWSVFFTIVSLAFGSCLATGAQIVTVNESQFRLNSNSFPDLH